MLFFGGLWTFEQCVPSTAYSFSRAKYFWFTGRQLSSHSASSTKNKKGSVENSISNSVYRASARFMFTFNVRLPFIRLAPEWLIVKLLNEKWILDENNSRDAGKRTSDVYVKSLPHLATLLRSKVHICFRTVLSGDDKKAEKERKIRFMWQSQPRHRQHNQNLC